MMHLKLELIVSSCEKSASGVIGKVSECAKNPRKNVSLVCILL